LEYFLLLAVIAAVTFGFAAFHQQIKAGFKNLFEAAIEAIAQ